MSVLEKFFIFGDFGKDLDDEHALVDLAGLVKRGDVQLVGVVGNLHPADLRARIAKGTLNQLGLTEVPVAVGKAVVDDPSKMKVADYESDVPYIARAEDVEPNGEALLLGTLRSAKEPITLVLQSGLTDAVDFIKKYPELAKEKIKHIQIMGGVDVVGGNKLKPNNANNNTFDMASAEKLYELITGLGIPSTTVSRFAAAASKIPFELYDRLKATGHPVGECLYSRQIPALQRLWGQACAAPGSKERGDQLPERCDRAWYVGQFFGGRDPGIANDADVKPYLEGFNLYDPINFVAGVPGLRERFFSPKEIKIGGTKHYIIGETAANHGVKDPAALRDFLVELGTEALHSRANPPQPGMNLSRAPK